MTDTANHDTKDSGTSWDTYWQGANAGSALNFGGVNHPSVDAFWREYLSEFATNKNNFNHLDLASGNGAVISAAKTIFNQKKVVQTALDLSESAIKHIKSVHPEVTVQVADASSVPFDSASFDLVTSQFGVEYAGPAAIMEAARLVSPGGQLILLIHRNPGTIYQECKNNYDAVSGLLLSEFIPLASKMFEAAFAAIKGASRDNYEKAARNFSPAIKALENIMRDLGKEIAGGTLAKLYDDIASIHEKVLHHDEKLVLKWLSQLEAEIKDYAERMSSMMKAALNDREFGDCCEKIRQQNFDIEVSDSLIDPQQQSAISWVLIANKSNN